MNVNGSEREHAGRIATFLAFPTRGGVKGTPDGGRHRREGERRISNAVHCVTYRSSPPDGVSPPPFSCGWTASLVSSAAVGEHREEEEEEGDVVTARPPRSGPPFSDRTGGGGGRRQEGEARLLLPIPFSTAVSTKGSRVSPLLPSSSSFSSTLRRMRWGASMGSE